MRGIRILAPGKERNGLAMKKQMMHIASIALAIMWMQCSTSDNPSNGNTQPACACQDILVLEQHYQLTGSDSIMLVTDMRVDTARSCAGATMLSKPDTTRADTLYVQYRQRSDSLLLTSDELNAIAWFFPALDKFLVFTRQGSGAGIQGTWYLSAVTYEDPDSTLNSITRAIADSAAYVWSQSIKDSATAYLIISAERLHTYEQNQTAAAILDEWAPQSAQYSILAEKQSDCQVKFTGNHSAETVTVCGADGTTIVYQSSNQEHAEYTYYTSNPLQCPNNKYPEWWAQFLEANRN
jgi:hypothetical protein